MGFTNTGLPNGGRTTHYQISYDESLSAADGLTRATQLFEACEADFNLMASWFNGVGFKFSFPIYVEIANASGGAGWEDPPDIDLISGYNPTVTIKPGTGTSSVLVRYLLVSEVTEMFMASKDNGWYESTSLLSGADEGSKGEGLSRFLGCQFMLANGFQNIRFTSFEVVKLWLNSTTRPNFVDNDPDDNQPDNTTGCTTCFIYFLHDQLGFSINAIIDAGADTLAEVYTNLTGRTDAWVSFINLVNLHYPPGVVYHPNGDNIFPVPDLESLSDAQILAGTVQNIRLLELDTQTHAEVSIGLRSSDPATLSVPATVSVPIGDWAVGVNLTAALIEGPPRNVTLSASYAGKMLSSNIQVVPAKSVITGHVTDAAMRPISDASILLGSSMPITPLSGYSLQLSTDASGSYTTPYLPPWVYAVSASQSGYVPSQAAVIVQEGVPVTVQDFVLTPAKPITVFGEVTDESANAISGATVTLVQNAATPGIVKCITDEFGQYSISMNPGSYTGSYTITAEDTGYQSTTVGFPIANGATINQNFIILLLASLTGTVRNTAGTPIQGALVRWGTVSVNTDVNGQYTLNGIEPGNDFVYVNAPGYNTAELNIAIAPGGTTKQDFTLSQGSVIISGRVIDTESSSPIANATVQAGALWAKTDTNGKYTLANVPAGQTSFTVSALHYQPHKAIIELTDNEMLTLDFSLNLIKKKGSGGGGKTLR